MSTPASRKRQRHRRRARAKLWAAQRELAEREVDLVAYTRVLIDMNRRELPSEGSTQAVTLVLACRDATVVDRGRLMRVVADLETRATALEAQTA